MSRPRTIMLKYSCLTRLVQADPGRQCLSQRRQNRQGVLNSLRSLRALREKYTRDQNSLNILNKQAKSH